MITTLHVLRKGSFWLKNNIGIKSYGYKLALDKHRLGLEIRGTL